MKGVLLILLGMMLAGFTVVEDKKLKGTGYVLLKQRPVHQSFTRVSVQQAITLYLAQDTTTTIAVEADDNLLPYIKTEVVDGQLNIYIDPNVVVSRFTQMNVIVGMPVVTDLNIATAARLEGATPIRVARLDIVASGAGSVKLEVKGSEVEVDASGAAKLELKGEVARLDLDLSSSAYLKAWDLHVVDCDAELSSAAKAEIYVTGVLKAEITSAGIVIYDGTPRSIVHDVSSRGVLVKRR